MTRPTKRLLGAALLALCGCGKTTPEPNPKPEQNAGTPGTPAPAKVDPKTGAKVDPSGLPLMPTLPGPALLAPSDPVHKLAEEFIGEIRRYAEKPGKLPQNLQERLAPSFLQVIGKPLETDADKKLGYNLDAASAWLRRGGSQLLTGIGLPTGYGSPAAAVFTGSFASGAGRFHIRFNLTEGSKVAWFSLGTLEAPPKTPTSPEGTFQDFAVLAFLDSLTSKAMPRDDRVLLLGGVIAPKLKNSWAGPFDQDKALGFDYNRTQLGAKLDELAKGVTAFTRTPLGGDSYKIELTRNGGKEVRTLKLAKGAAPGEWLVEEFR